MSPRSKKKSQKSVEPSTLKGLDRRYDSDAPAEIESDVLETFPYEYPGRDVVIDIETDEFTAVCPYSGLPDFATIRVHYVPGNDIIELRSFKYYLFSYRNVGIYQEHVVSRILEDLVRSCSPKWMQVVADYHVRGGVHTVASVESGEKPAPGSSRPYRQGSGR
jgi:7-cyano-7-deazaguanine reductase